MKHPGWGAGTRLSLKALVDLARPRSLSLISCFARSPLPAARLPSADTSYIRGLALGRGRSHGARFENRLVRARGSWRSRPLRLTPASTLHDKGQLVISSGQRVEIARC